VHAEAEQCGTAQEYFKKAAEIDPKISVTNTAANSYYGNDDMVIARTKIF
jgi:hypothetical protein